MCNHLSLIIMCRKLSSAVLAFGCQILMNWAFEILEFFWLSAWCLPFGWISSYFHSFFLSWDVRTIFEVVLTLRWHGILDGCKVGMRSSNRSLALTEVQHAKAAACHQLQKTRWMCNYLWQYIMAKDKLELVTSQVFESRWNAEGFFEESSSLCKFSYGRFTFAFTHLLTSALCWLS